MKFIPFGAIIQRAGFVIAPDKSAFYSAFRGRRAQNFEMRMMRGT
jgi:hypothetical protein